MVVEWSIIRAQLVKEYGEDITHDSILACLVRLEYVRNPLAYCRKIAHRRQALENSRACRFVYQEKEGVTNYTTEDIAILREIIRALPLTFWDEKRPYKAIRKYKHGKFLQSVQ